ncbi:exported protein of unknown function [Beijerinckiaceae bacterium RH AL1]|nr:hypothetical protein [Beijerinckiaceae bacterium]VVB43830.1 exported protein of unknown function [Beijerinckiaceae bacterium RH AL8]VVB43837.1 exported protein of unknown function [Beijerinckiaceae bacterium RH CH11]VVC54031.1 exported protein of unknown function [Beijerinckiaceae bacterium RH AL1]
MKTLVHIIAVLSVVAAATPSRAYAPHHALPGQARDVQATAPRALPRAEAAPGVSLGGDDDTHQTATGGPSGSLF